MENSVPQPLIFVQKKDVYKRQVLCRAELSNWDFAVLGTGILRNTLAVVGAVDIHLATAIGAIEQARDVYKRQGYRETIANPRASAPHLPCGAWGQAGRWAALVA